jgi:hypothetical protein
LTKVVSGCPGVLLIVPYLRGAQRKNYANITNFLVKFLIKEKGKQKKYIFAAPTLLQPFLDAANLS